MNRIVKNDYPVERLPDELRELVDPNRKLRLVLEQPDEEAESRSLTRFAGRFPLDVSQHEAVARIRSLRDEWD